MLLSVSVCLGVEVQAMWCVSALFPGGAARVQGVL